MSSQSFPDLPEASQAEAMKVVATPHPWIWAFLDGSAGYMGVHYGERHPDHPGLFWWRLFLRAELKAIRDNEANAKALAGEVKRLRAEVAVLTADAERWKYVRYHWSNAQMHWNNDATNSLKSIVVTIKTAHLTSGADDLDRQIDSARALAQKEEKNADQA